MKKIIFPEANDALFNELQGRFATFIDNDKFYSRVKEASSNVITRKMLEDCKPDKDHFAIHFVGVGDYEKYGFNKNADAFPKIANEKYYKTFETNAKLYREHKSSNPKNAIGIIKKAAYNPDMGRIEVVVWANIKKASAEYEKARSGQALSCSMGMRCPCDRDNISGKICKTPASYEPWMKTMPCQYIEEWDGKPINKYAFVYNDDFTFFDLSIVAKPAERIAHYLEYKFASINDYNKSIENDHIPSAVLANMLGYNNDSNCVLPLDKSELLKKLASAEDLFHNVLQGQHTGLNHVEAFIKNVAINSFDKKASNDASGFNKDLLQLKQVNPRTLFRELAKRASILPFNSFMDVFYGKDNIKDIDMHEKAIKFASVMLVPQLFRNLSDCIINPADEVHQCCSSEEVFDCGDALEAALDTSKDPVANFMNKVEEKLSLDPKIRGERVIKLTISINIDNPSATDIVDMSTIKEASDYQNNNEIVKLAKRYAVEYGLYKLSALNDIAKLKGDNFVDDYTIFTTIAQNFTNI